MNLNISAPSYFSDEIEYVGSFIFSSRDFSVDYFFSDDINCIVIKFGIYSIESSIDFFEKFYKCGRVFAGTVEKLYLNKYNLKCDFEDNILPILFGKNSIEFTEYKAILGFDFFGTLFYFMSGYDELKITNRDLHGRVSAFDSAAFKLGFLHRPVVDEYVFLLFEILKLKGIGTEKKLRVGKVIYTCDVDYPFDEAIFSIKKFCYELCKDILLRKNVLLFIKRLFNFILFRFNIHIFDPYYTFRSLLVICNRYNCDMEFFFIADNYDDSINGYYQLDNKIAKIIQELLLSGAKIGVHGSYNSYKSQEKILNEKRKFEDFLKNFKINAEVTSIRQHYLQIDFSCTPPLFVNAGYKSDFTGGYADYPGFRFGTSKPFYMWDHMKKRKLDLLQRPLIVMEASLFAKRYLNLKYDDQTLNFVLKLKDNCLKYGGDFVFLWHNSHFNSKNDFTFFESILSGKQSKVLK